MTLTIIAAVAPNGAIGNRGQLPWHIPQDLQHFKRTTWGGNLIMGRKTRDSLPMDGLKNRRLIVLTRDKDYTAKNTTCVHSFRGALLEASTSDTPVFVIGGAAIYALAMTHVTHAIITRVEGCFVGDTYMPPIGAHVNVTNITF